MRRQDCVVLEFFAEGMEKVRAEMFGGSAIPPSSGTGTAIAFIPSVFTTDGVNGLEQLPDYGPRQYRRLDLEKSKRQEVELSDRRIVGSEDE